MLVISNTRWLVRSAVSLALVLASATSNAQSALEVEIAIGEQKISSTSGGFAGPFVSVSSLRPPEFGESLAALGDLDGDGVPDLAVGAAGDDDGGPDRGSVWILFLESNGSVRAEQRISSSSGGLSFAIPDRAYFGHSVTTLGDWNGDGTTDLVVAGDNKVWILLLNPDGTVASDLRAVPSITAVGTIEGIGDLDGDGRCELAIQNPGASPQLSISFLNADGTARATQPIGNGIGGFGNSQIWYFGSSIAAIGDANGDGVPDIAVADDFTGKVFTLLLNSDGTVLSEFEVPFVSRGVCPSPGFGLAGTSDRNGDGIDDLLATVLQGGGLFCPGEPEEVRIFHMQSDGTTRPGPILGEGTGGFAGDLDREDLFGVGLATIGDLDGNGVDDIAIGAPFDDDGGSRFGAVWTVSLECALAGIATRSGANRTLIQGLSLPVLGASWEIEIDARPRVGKTALLGAFGTAANGRMIKTGQLLVDPSTLVFLMVVPLGDGATVVTMPPIPNDTALCGFLATFQALVGIRGEPNELSNALDVALGY